MGITFYSLAEQNRRKTFLLISVLTLLLCFLGFLVDAFYLDFPHHFPYPIFSLIAFLVALTQALIAYYQGDRIVLSSLRARPASREVLQERMLINVVEEMSIASGLPIPKVYIIDSEMPNACATGRTPSNASICVTSGLLDMMDREELQGVIGHEIAHIRNRDILVMTVTAVLLGTIVILADLVRRFPRADRENYGVGRGKGRGSPILLVFLIIFAILAPLIARLIFLAVSRSREYIADAHGAEFTRNPLGLAQALEKIERYQASRILKGVPSILANPALAHLFIADPLNRGINEREGFWATLWSTHPPILRRIQLLKEMAV